MKATPAFNFGATRITDLFWTPVHRLSLRILRLLVPTGNLTIISPDGRGTSIGNGVGDFAVVRMNTYSSLPKMLVNPLYRIGSHYVDGEWVIEKGRLANVLALFVNRGSRFEQYSTVGRSLYNLRRFLFVCRQRYGIRRSFRNVESHYDFGDDLFEAFLDSKLNYTCADFEHGAADIDEAQDTKLTNTLRRLELKPGHRLLEIGCGWGALSRLASLEYGAEVIALTISRNQLRYAQKAADELCGAIKPTYLYQDYRQHARGKSALYDRIVSVGMLEHVGFGQIGTYFSTMSRLLKPSGVALVHTIARYRLGVTNPWIERHIFPGGYMAQENEILQAAKQHGLELCPQTYRYDSDNYIRTLRQWDTRFKRSWPVLLKHKYPDRVRRTYEFYFAASEAAFRETDMHVAQLVFRKIPGKKV